jgi:ketosteroid isomerase-like protein
MAALPWPAPAAADATREVADQQQIRDLVARFAEIVNGMVPGDMGQVFTPDAEFEIRGWTQLAGVDQIIGFLTGVIGHWDMIFQAVGSGRVVISGDVAEGVWYVTEYGRYRDGNETFLGGRYTDRYVRTEAGWRFARREFRGMFRRAQPLGDRLQVWGPKRPH